jgi:hypothetical protein
LPPARAIGYAGSRRAVAGAGEIEAPGTRRGKTSCITQLRGFLPIGGFRFISLPIYGIFLCQCCQLDGPFVNVPRANADCLLQPSSAFPPGFGRSIDGMAIAASGWVVSHGSRLVQEERCNALP